MSLEPATLRPLVATKGGADPFAILAGIVYGYGAIEGSRRLALRVGRKAPPTGRDPAELQH